MRTVRDPAAARADYNNARIQQGKEGDGSMKKQASRVALTAIAMAAAAPAFAQSSEFASGAGIFHRF